MCSCGTYSSVFACVCTTVSLCMCTNRLSLLDILYVAKVSHTFVTPSVLTLCILVNEVNNDIHNPFTI